MIDPTILFAKTLKGAEEIQDRKFNLSNELRMILIMADGKRTAQQLEKQFGKLGNIQKLLETLWTQGFIEPQNTVGHSSIPPAPAMANPRSAPSPFQIKYQLEVQIKQHFGLMAAPLLNKLEKYHTADELYGYAVHCRQVIAGSFSEKKAEAFWEDAKKIFALNQ